MKIHFLGADRNVTGSKHLIEVNGKKILLDCGLFQGRRQESFEKNMKMPFNPREIDAVVLSHAHIDHCGALPVMIKDGFTGNIYCSTATADITEVMLLDSAYIQEKDTEYFANKLSKTALKPIEPIYTEKDAVDTANHFARQMLHREFKVTDNVFCTLYDAGHVLGSEIVVLRIIDEGKEKKLIFTGDLGRSERNLLEDPEFVEQGDILITESTYGLRFHPPTSDNRIELKRVVNETITKGGKLIIPSFALERTQELVYDLNLLINDNEIPKIPIYIDSPLASKVTKIFSKHPELFDEETHEDFLSAGKRPFGNIIFTESAEESKAINAYRGSCIVISASGMCEAGRIRHHLRNSIADPKNTILIVGFMAENTLGRMLVEKREFVKIFDEMYKVRADIEIINGYSGHGDQSDLLKFATHIKGLKNIFVVHGEESQAMGYAEILREKIAGAEVVVPYEGDVIET